MKLSPEHLDLRAQVAKHISIDVAKDGTPTTKGTDTAFAAVHTPDQVKSVEEGANLASNFYLASTGAVADVSLDAFKKNPKLKSVEFVFPLTGKDQFTVSVDREKTYPKPGKPGESVTVYGVIKTELDTVSSRTNRGVMKQICSDAKEKAATLFGS